MFLQTFLTIEPESGVYWRGLDGGYGNAGARPERRSRAGMAGGAGRPVPRPFWRESDKSQGFGDRVPKCRRMSAWELRSDEWCLYQVGYGSFGSRFHGSGPDRSTCGLCDIRLLCLLREAHRTCDWN